VGWGVGLDPIGLVPLAHVSHVHRLELQPVVVCEGWDFEIPLNEHRHRVGRGLYGG
jgi:hypothetical protein